MADDARRLGTVLVLLDREPSGDDGSPWARGGSMSHVPIPPAADDGIGEPVDGTPGRPRSTSPLTWLVFATGATVVVLTFLACLVVMSVMVLGSDARSAPTTPPPVADQPEGGRTDPRDTFVQLPPVTASTQSVLGTITWTSVEGPEASLPSRVSDASHDRLTGDDETGRRWESSDGGRHWVPVEVEQVVAGAAYASELVTAPDGLRATVTPTGSDGGVPIELGGERYVLATRRVQLPWDVITGASEGDPYRVRISAGERRLTAVAGDFHEMPTTRFEVRAARGGAEHQVVDDVGAVVWSFAAGSSSAAVDAIVGRLESVWLRWDGELFVPAHAPWPPEHEVELVETSRGLFALSFDQANRVIGLWRTTDGRSWDGVRLPDLPGEEWADAIHAGDDETIVAILAADGFTNWATRDGKTFDRLPAVPGITNRSVGAVGWVVADPRGHPVVRVSVDGTTWDPIDIGPLLDPDDGPLSQLTTSVVDDTIYVTTSRAGRRTLLIGEVTGAG